MPAVALGSLAGILVFALDRPARSGASGSVSAAGDPNVTGDTVADSSGNQSVDTTVPVTPAWRTPTTAVSVDNIGAGGGSSAGSSDASSAPPPTLGRTVRTTTATTVAVKTTVASDTCRKYNGPTEWNDYGPVQVSASVAHSGKICSVSVMQHPSGGRSTTINDRAVPRLISQAMAAQSASIAGVSGATYTSNGFRQSLQAILNAAKH
jgi:uncharacterized protein with FMN-binding domain